MITLTLISLFILLFFTGLLFIPLRLEINTDKKQYYLALPGYFRIDAIFNNEIIPKIRVRLFFIRFSIEQRLFKKKVKTTLENSKKIARNHRKSPSISLAIKLLKAIKIKKLDADIDTGDFPLNAQLIPVAALLGTNNRRCDINFENRNRLHLRLTTQLYKILLINAKHK